MIPRPAIATAVLVAIGLAAVLLAGRAGPAAPGPMTAPDGQEAARPAFALRTADGRPFTAEQLRGRVALVYFGFTSCPDICPGELGWMARVLRQLGPLEPSVQGVFITVDPARDTPPMLAEYAALFHPRLVALHGSEAETAAAAAAFGVIYQRQTPVSRQDGFYLIDHTLSTFVLAPDGRIAHRLDSRDTSPEAAAALIRALVR